MQSRQEKPGNSAAGSHPLPEWSGWLSDDSDGSRSGSGVRRLNPQPSYHIAGGASPLARGVKPAAGPMNPPAVNPSADSPLAGGTNPNPRGANPAAVPVNPAANPTAGGADPLIDVPRQARRPEQVEVVARYGLAPPCLSFSEGEAPTDVPWRFHSHYLLCVHYQVYSTGLL